MKILIVEDDPTLASIVDDLIRQTLTDVTVLWSPTVEGALLFLDAETIDLVVSDNNLAGEMKGTDLWRNCALRYPALPFILMSGDRYADIKDKLVLKGAVTPPFVSKPFRGEMFRNLVLNTLKGTITMRAEAGIAA
jgi:DNA-binding NtrC family response regulator